MPLGDTGANEALAIEDPAEFAAEVVSPSAGGRRGIAVYGKQRTRHTELPAVHSITRPRGAGAETNPRALQNRPPGAGRLSIAAAD